MLAKKLINDGEIYQEILIECPSCSKRKKLMVPDKIINQSKQLTTVSIPLDLVCEHSFQAFIDKNFKVRGYQLVDFEFSKIEFYEGGLNSAIEEFGDKWKAEEDRNLSALPIFQDIINILRNGVDDKEILGTAILRFDGKVVYSSLPNTTLAHTIKEFEVRNTKELVSVKKMFLELENNQKVCSEYLKIGDIKFILVLMVSSKVKLGMGNLFLRELVKGIMKLIGG